MLCCHSFFFNENKSSPTNLYYRAGVYRAGGHHPSPAHLAIQVLLLWTAARLLCRATQKHFTVLAVYFSLLHLTNEDSFSKYKKDHWLGYRSGPGFVISTLSKQTKHAKAKLAIPCLEKENKSKTKATLASNNQCTSTSCLCTAGRRTGGGNDLRWAFPPNLELDNRDNGTCVRRQTNPDVQTGADTLNPASGMHTRCMWRLAWPLKQQPKLTHTQRGPRWLMLALHWRKAPVHSSLPTSDHFPRLLPICRSQSSP